METGPAMSNELHRRALLLSYLTVGYNLLEGAVSLLAAGLSGSPALLGFGLDSFVESLSGMVVLWRFRQHGRVTVAEEERVERRATRFVAVTFFILAAYVLHEALGHLRRGEPPEASGLGIAIAVASLLVMPLLARAKLRTGQALGSRSLIADAKETLACLWLSVALLMGLLLNAVAGLWWADPVAGLFIVAFLVREGAETWRDEEAEPAAAEDD